MLKINIFFLDFFIFSTDTCLDFSLHSLCYCAVMISQRACVHGECPKISNTLFSTFFYLNLILHAVVSLKYLEEWQTVKTLIRLQQSDLGLHCLHMPFYQKLRCMKIRTFTIYEENFMLPVIYLQNNTIFGSL